MTLLQYNDERHLLIKIDFWLALPQAISKPIGWLTRLEFLEEGEARNWVIAIKAAAAAAHQSCSSPPHLQSSLARMLTPFHGHLGLDAEMSWGPPTDFRNLARDGLSQSCIYGNFNVWYDVIRLTIWVNLEQCTIWPSTHLSSRLLMPQKCGCLVWEFLDYWRSTYFMSELQSYLAV